MKQTTLRILGLGAAMLLHPRAAEAQTAPPAPSVDAPAAEPSTVAPPAWSPPPGWGPRRSLYGMEEAPVDAPRSTKGYWYGWQIIIPNALAEMAGLISLAAQSVVGMTISGIARGTSGSIIHFAHGNPGKAGVSFLLEGVLPTAMIATTVASINACRGSGCLAPTMIGVIGIPITLIGGTIVDTALFAVEDNKPASASARGRGGATYALAPLLVAPLQPQKVTANAGRKGWLEEAPMGLSLVGRF